MAILSNSLIPVPLETSEKGWIRAKDLKVGHRVFDGDGKPCTVTSIRTEKHETQKISLTDETEISYYSPTFYGASYQDRRRNAGNSFYGFNTARETIRYGGDLNYSLSAPPSLDLPAVEGLRNPYETGVYLPQIISTDLNLTLYLRGSLEQRLELLRGFMDFNGSIDKAGKCEVTTCSRKLALLMMELLYTVGFIPKIYVKAAANRATRFRIYFLPILHACFKDPEKLKRVRNNYHTRSLTRYIEDLHTETKQEFVCFTTDSASHLVICLPSFIALPEDSPCA